MLAGHVRRSRGESFSRTCSDKRLDLVRAKSVASCIPTALIIGNSDGIGLALTKLLLDEGWHVVGISRSARSVEAVAYEHHVMDVQETGYRTTLNSIIVATAVDVCVYCVGVGERLDVETLASERSIFEVNLIGAVTTAQEVIPAMVRVGQGHFVALSSQADQIVNPAAPSYSASKAGLSSYLEGLAPACRQKGVCVTNIRFGFVDTKMAKESFRPFMISADEAARRIRVCMGKKPVRYTFPKSMAALLWLVRLTAAVRRCF